MKYSLILSIVTMSMFVSVSAMEKEEFTYSSEAEFDFPSEDEGQVEKFQERRGRGRQPLTRQEIGQSSAVSSGGKSGRKVRPQEVRAFQNQQVNQPANKKWYEFWK